MPARVPSSATVATAVPRAWPPRKRKVGTLQCPGSTLRAPPERRLSLLPGLLLRLYAPPLDLFGRRLGGGRRPRFPLRPRVAFLRDEGRERRHRGPAPVHVLHHPVVRAPLLGCDRATHVAALVVVELDVGVRPRYRRTVDYGVRAVAVAGYGGAHVLGGHRLRVRVVEVGLDVVRPVGVDVPGEDHGVGHLVSCDEVADPVALALVAVPDVHGEEFPSAALEVQPGEEHLLGEHVPRGPGVAEALEEPPLLLLAGERAPRVSGLAVRRVDAVLVRLVVAVLAGVQDVEAREVAEGEHAVEAHVRTPRHRPPPQGHVLVVGLVGRRPAPEEPRTDYAVLRDLVGVVVLDLVVVPS